MVGIAPSTGHFGPGSSEKGSTLEPSKPARRARAALVLLAVTAFIGWLRVNGKPRQVKRWNYSTCRAWTWAKMKWRLPLSLEHFWVNPLFRRCSQVQQLVGLGLWQQSCFQALYAMSTTSLVGICCCYSLRKHRKPVSNLIKLTSINAYHQLPNIQSNVYIFKTSRAYPPTPSHHVTTPSHYHHPPVDHITEFSYTFFHRQLQIRACFRPKERMWNEWAWHPHWNQHLPTSIFQVPLLKNYTFPWTNSWTPNHNHHLNQTFQILKFRWAVPLSARRRRDRCSWKFLNLGGETKVSNPKMRHQLAWLKRQTAWNSSGIGIGDV